MLERGLEMGRFKYSIEEILRIPSSDFRILKNIEVTQPNRIKHPNIPPKGAEKTKTRIILPHEGQHNKTQPYSTRANQGNGERASEALRFMVSVMETAGGSLYRFYNSFESKEIEILEKIPFVEEIFKKMGNAAKWAVRSTNVVVLGLTALLVYEILPNNIPKDMKSLELKLASGEVVSEQMQESAYILQPTYDAKHKKICFKFTPFSKIKKKGVSQKEYIFHGSPNAFIFHENGEKTSTLYYNQKGLSSSDVAVSGKSSIATFILLYIPQEKMKYIRAHEPISKDKSLPLIVQLSSIKDYKLSNIKGYK